MPEHQPCHQNYSITASVRECVGPVSTRKEVAIENAKDIHCVNDAIAAADMLMQVLLMSDTKAGVTLEKMIR